MTYAKSACILHMLRYVLGDAGFFQILKEYASDTARFKYQTAVTDDFALKISESSNSDLSWFVEQWIKQPNHPVYENVYQFVNAGGGYWNVSFRAKQVQTNTPFHRMPLVVKITFTSGPDSVIRIDNTVNNQVWQWSFNRQPNLLVFDPNNDIVLKLGTTSPGVITGISGNQNQMPGSFALYQNYPNPFNPKTTIKYNIPSSGVGSKHSVRLIIYDINGKQVLNIAEQTDAGSFAYTFDGSNLASGVYFYKIFAAGSSNEVIFTDCKKMLMIK
jgi:hypothetical protein